MDILRRRIEALREAQTAADSAARQRLDREIAERQELQRQQAILAKGHAILDGLLTRAIYDTRSGCEKVASALLKKHVDTDFFMGFFGNNDGWLLYLREGTEGYEAPDPTEATLFSSYVKRRGAGRMLRRDASVVLFTTGSRNNIAREEGVLDLSHPYVTGRSPGGAIGFDGYANDALSRLGINIDSGITPTQQHLQRALVLSDLNDDLARLALNHRLELEA